MDNTQVTEVPNAEPGVNTPQRPSRLRIREAVLNSQVANEIVEAFGERIEIRYPSLQDLLQYRDAQNDDFIMARAIINNCYDPESGERIFEDADAEVLMQQKFTPDMRKLNASINKILGGDETIVKSVEDNTKSNTE